MIIGNAIFLHLTKSTILYKSERVGKNGRVFLLLKFRTLKENVDKISSFANKEQYTWCGRFLRKSKLDELPQLWNWIKRDIDLVGYRAEEKKTIDILPKHMKELLLSVRPGLTSLSSIHYFDEDQILENSLDPYKDYWLKIKPTKFVLDAFYIRNRDLLLDGWIIWKTFILILKSFFK